MSEETIFHEVTDELRRDRMRQGWRRYGPYLIGAAVVVVLLVAANEGWSWWQNSNSARSSDQFYAALDLESAGKLAEAQTALGQLATQGTGQYPVLAKFKQAGLLATQGKKDEALAAYDAIANSEGNQQLKELALLFAANALVDKGDVAGVKSRVQGLLTPNDPLRNAARETLGLAQYKAGDLNAARDSFEAVINDPTSTSEARGRMQIYIAQLVAQGATPPAGDQAATAGATAGAAAVEAASGATPAPAANDNSAATDAAAKGGTPAPASTPPASSAATQPAAPAADSAPTGVESSQPSTPDAALELAVPPSPAAAAPASEAAPALSTGVGLPTPDAGAAQPAGTVSAPAGSSTPATGTVEAPPASGSSGQ